MSNIERIKAEIERLYDGEAPKHDQQCEFEDGYFTGIATISKFIDSLPEESENHGCGVEFPHFGANYPDAKCIDGYLWDMDSYEDGVYTIGGDDPCPICNTEKWLKDVLDDEIFRTRDEALEYVKMLKSKYKHKDSLPECEETAKISPEKYEEELNEEIQGFIDEYGYERGEDKILIAIVARHFVEWAKHKESLQVPETCKENQDSFTSLEEAADEYAGDSTGFIDMTAYNAFIAGAEWQKEQEQ